MEEFGICIPFLKPLFSELLLPKNFNSFEPNIHLNLQGSFNHQIVVGLVRALKRLNLILDSLDFLLTVPKVSIIVDF